MTGLTMLIVWVLHVSTGLECWAETHGYAVAAWVEFLCR